MIVVDIIGGDLGKQGMILMSKDDSGCNQSQSIDSAMADMIRNNIEI